jgi:hypothetical protein
MNSTRVSRGLSSFFSAGRTAAVVMARFLAALGRSVSSSESL